MHYRPGNSADIAPLVILRIAFGLMMTIGTARFMLLGWIEEHYTTPLLHFHYFGFSWVQPLNVAGMYLVHTIMLLAAIGITLGAFYRLSALLFFLTFTYTELIDLTYYLNHYYFVSIASFLLILVPANRYFSVDAWRNPSLTCTHVPRWSIDIFKLQTAIVYTFAGIAKINSNWLLQALPLRIWLPAHDDLPLLGWLMPHPATAYVFSWIGMIYDCTIVWWLMNQRTRPWAYLSVLVFHIITGMLFQIGIFPLVMITTTLIFFSDGFHHRLIHVCRKLFRQTERLVSHKKYSLQPLTQKAVYTFLLVHFVVQLLFPFRYLLYPGNLFWNEEGYRFSWRVMLMEKAATATFFVQDARNGHEGQVVNSEFLNTHQEKQMASQPDMIWQFAHWLKQHYEASGIPVSSVRAEVYATLNAQPSQLLIDPNTNLLTEEDNWKHKNWITDFEE